MTAALRSLSVSLTLVAAFTGEVAAATSTASPAQPSANTAPAMKSAPQPSSRYEIFQSEGRPALTCSLMVPEDFQRTEIPATEVDFEKSHLFMPLGVMMAPYGPMVIAVGTRPAYGDGAVAQWLAFCCREEGYEHGPVTTMNANGLRAVTCEARQQGEGIQMHMRFMLLEDGGRAYQVCVMAPVQIWPAVEGKADAILKSFRLAQLFGQKTPLTVAEVGAAEEAHAKPAAEAAATEEPGSSAAATHAADPVEAADAAPVIGHADESPAPRAECNDAEWKALVLAEDGSALDPEHRMNANLRDRGVGLVPNVISADLDRKAATVGAGALEGLFTVPFGWHVVDDGRRTLVFDGAGKIQINLSQRAREHASLAELGQSYLADYRAKQPDLETLTMEIGAVTGVAVRGVVIDGETLDQTFLLRDIGRSGRVLVARVTAESADMTRALNLAGDIVARFQPAEMLAAK